MTGRPRSVGWTCGEATSLSGNERLSDAVSDLSHAPSLSRDAAVFGASFLHHPEHLPGRTGSRAWGRCRLVVHFAGGPYAFVGLARSQRDAIRARFSDYAGTPGTTPAVVTRVRRIPEAAFRRFDLAGWRYAMEFEARPEWVRAVGLTFVSRLEVGPTLSATLWTSLAGEGLFLEGIENTFRVTAAYRLLQLGGALLHSAAVVVAGRAYLFLGPSGTGKTTIATNASAAGFAVLSDDMNAVAPSREGTMVEKLPFAGLLGTDPAPAQPFRLGGVYRLRQAPHLALRPVGHAEMVGYAAACAPYLNADPHRTPALLEALASLLRQVPRGVLEVARDTPFDQVAALLEAGQ